MSNIRIKNLPGDATPNKTDILAVDSATTRGVTIENAVKIGRPFASQSEAQAGTDATKAMSPLTVAQAIAAQGATQFATFAQGATADTAVQPGDLASVATSGDYDDLSNLPTLGTAAATDATAYATAAQGAAADSAVQALVGGVGITIDATDPNNPIIVNDGDGSGDMLKAVFDPDNVGANAFDQDNMVDGTTNKNFTATEKTKLSGIGAGADMVSANNLSDLASAPTALDNLGAGTAGKVIFADADGQDTFDQIIDKNFTGTITNAAPVALAKLLNASANPSILLIDNSIVSDGSTDQTSKIVAAIEALDADSFRGPLHIPYNTKFDLGDVYAAVDAAVGLVLLDDSSINWHMTASYKVKMFRVTYTGDLVDDDCGQMWASGHHPALFLNNFGTAGTTSGARRYSTILHGAGRDPFGNYVTGLYQQVGDHGTGRWSWGLFLNTQFDIATKCKIWTASTVVAVDDIVVNAAGNKVYIYTVGGTTGTTEPTHSSGTAADGTATAKFYQAGIETGGRSAATIDDQANMTLQAADGTGVITHTWAVHSLAGFGGYTFQLAVDDVNNKASLVLPAAVSNLNLGSVNTASTSQGGCSVFNGGGSNFQVFLTNATNGGLARITSNTIAASWASDRFYTAGTVVGSISQTTSATAFNTSSDYRLKPVVETLVDFTLTSEQFSDLPETLLRVMLLRPVRHNWAQEPDVWTHGFIAHEAQPIVPHAVTGVKDEMEEIGTAAIPDRIARAEYDDDGKEIVPEHLVQEPPLTDIRECEAPEGSTWTKTGERPVYQGIDTGKMVADLTAALQSLTLIVLEQKERIAALEAKIAA